MKTTLKMAVFYLLAVTSFTTSTFASSVPLALGLQGGVDFGSGKVTPDPSVIPGVSQVGRLGLGLGVFAEIGVPGVDWFFVQPELMYMQKGYKYNTDVPLPVSSYLYKFNYLELPILAKAKFRMGGWAPFVFLGPTVGYRLAASVDSSSNGTTTTTDLRSNTTALDIGVDAGIGVDFDITSTMGALISARYSYGLTNIDRISLETIKNRGVEVLVGIRYTFD